jgi:transcriptional regulator with XRE-family HTH domain/tetratricopeptide (TPR) repeat protein
MSAEQATAPRFGELLRRYRRAAGLTQEALAERAGLSALTISALERGVKHTPRNATVSLLAEALALTTRDRAAFEAAGRRGGTFVPPTPLPGGAPTVPLVGRERELALLERHLTPSPAGLPSPPPALFLAGEPGIGKSRLLQETASQATGAGWTVLQGGCQRRGGQAPYVPVLEALEGHLTRQAPARLKAELAGCTWLARLLPELAARPLEPLPAWRLPPEQERRLVVGAVRRFLANVAGPAGTLLLLDDLQWVGADALDLLATLARYAAEIPLRVVAAYRDTEVPPQHPLSTTLADLAHAGLARQLTLAPLAPYEAEQLRAWLWDGAEGSPVAQRVVQRTGGVPFFLVSYAHVLREGAGEASTAGSPGAVPWDLAQGLRQRVAALPRVAQEVLEVGAVIGRVVPHALLAAAVDIPERQVVAGLEAASRARLLLAEEGQATYQFVHDVIREAVEAGVPVARRLALHRRIATALEAHAARIHAELPVEALAYHYGRSGDHARAVVYLERAGDRAAACYANAAAESHYRELVERLDGFGRTRDAAVVRLKLAGVLMNVAHYDAALAALEGAMEIYRLVDDREGLRSALAQMGNAYASRYTPEEGLARLLPLVESLDPGEATEGWAALHAALANLCYIAGRYADELTASTRALQLARALGDRALLATALERHGQALINANGQYAEARAVVDEACRAAEEAGALDVLYHAERDAWWLALNSGEFAAARRHSDRALTLAERQGDLVKKAICARERGVATFYMGDWQAARQGILSPLPIEIVDGKMGPSNQSCLDLLWKGRLCEVEGERDAARRYLAECSALATRGNYMGLVRAAERHLAEHDLEDGHPAAALARLTALLDHAGMKGMDDRELLPALAWTHLELGNVAQAETAIAQAITGLRADGHRLLDLIDALRVHAQIATRQGRWVEAEQALEEGLSLTRCIGYPYAEARLLYTQGMMYVQKRESQAAREPLEAALAIFRRLGAGAQVERVEQVLAAYCRLLPTSRPRRADAR